MALARLPPELLSHVFLVYVNDVHEEYGQFMDGVRPALRPRSHQRLPADATNVPRAKALERWHSRSSPWVWLKLLHVSRKWRNTALQCPRLWSWIVPELALWNLTGTHSRDFESFVQDSLVRSGNTPLRIGSRLWPGWSKAEAGQFARVFEQVYALFSRIRTAQLNVTPVNAAFLQSPPSPINAPILHNLELDMRGYPAETRLEGLAAASLPNLRILVIDGGTIELLTALSRATLRSLTYRSPRRTSSHLQILQLLQTMPLIQRLALLDVVAELPVNQFVAHPSSWPTMPHKELMVSLLNADEIHLTQSDLDGGRNDKVGLAMLFLLDCLIFPSSAAIWFDPPSVPSITALELSFQQFAVSSVSRKVCSKPNFVAQTVYLDGESGHRYIKFWDSEQSLEVLAIGATAEPARLACGVWGMAYVGTALWSFWGSVNVEGVKVVYISMEFDWLTWLALAPMEEVTHLCISGPTVFGALNGLVCRRTDDPDYPGREVLDEILAYREDENEDEDEDEKDELQGDYEDEYTDPDVDYIFPKLNTLVVRHMDASAMVSTSTLRRMDLFSYLIGALGRRKRINLGIRTLRLVEVFHFSPEHLARLREADIVDLVEWDGLEMTSLGRKLYDTEYVDERAYRG